MKELVDSGTIGSVRAVSIRFYKPPKEADYHPENLPWSVIPEISGGGYFFDLACHQLDFLDFLFGPIVRVNANAGNQGGLYSSENIITASFEFQNGVFGSGIWCFTAAHNADADIIEIIGDKGKISMSTFDFTPVILETGTGTESYPYDKPKHVQQYLIQTILDALLGKGTCPSTGHTAARTSRVMDEMVKEYYMNRSKRSLSALQTGQVPGGLTPRTECSDRYYPNSKSLFYSRGQQKVLARIITWHIDVRVEPSSLQETRHGGNRHSR